MKSSSRGGGGSDDSDVIDGRTSILVTVGALTVHRDGHAADLERGRRQLSLM